jgi:hypothetical protein
MSTSRKKVDTSQQDHQKKLKALGVLVGFIALVFVYQYFAASSLPPIAEKAPADDKYKNRVPANQLAANNDPNASQNPQNLQNINEQVIPALLDLNALEKGANTSANGERNPFEYPPPPLPPPPPPPKPATIKVGSLKPTSVYAKTKTFDVVINGTGFTDDMMIYLNGNPSFAKTIFVSSTELKATVPQNLFLNAGQLSFQVKKRGKEADEFSNPLNINILSPKDPASTFNMIGYFTDSKGLDSAVLSEKDPAKPTQIVQVGSILMPYDKSMSWQVVSINRSQIQLKDIKEAIDVVSPVSMKVEGSSSNATNTASNSFQASYDQVQYVDNGNGYVDPNSTINLNDALQNQSASGILGQTPEDIEKAKQIQQQNAQQFKVMNEALNRQREAILRQQQERQQQLLNQQPIPRNRPGRNR